jgi:tetraacyldisaccharide 4'-kinase
MPSFIECSSPMSRLPTGTDRTAVATRNQNRVDRIWYGRSPLAWLLLPLTGLFALLVRLRRWCYSSGILRVQNAGVPVIVVGNILAGGTGKTPITIWVTRMLRKRGHQPGIISRGYRGKVGAQPVDVSEDSEPGIVGDEAVMLARQCECPVVVHPDRVAAARKAVALGADILVADDGLQHYRLARDVEIAVVDADRGFGNGYLLPAGPLREPVSRLDEVDIVLTHRHASPAPDDAVLRRASDPRAFDFWLKAAAVVRLDLSEVRHLDDFAGQTVHAVAGIGHPERFFRMLESYHIKVYRHPLPDHAEIHPADIRFDDELDVLMTEKDAVKCRWLDQSRCWYVPVDVDFDGHADELLGRIFGKLGNAGIDKPEAVSQ